MHRLCDQKGIPVVLLIDNFDSFTYNIYQLVGHLGYEIKVIRRDSISIDDLKRLNPSHIIIGPGPGRPEENQFCLELVKQLGGKLPLLGICLGHEVLLHAYGVEIVNAKSILHGKTSKILHNEQGLFSRIPQNIHVVRYHSLVARPEAVPEDFEISALSEDGEVMAVEHKHHPLYGVQFHPESIGTEDGWRLLLNFLNYKKHRIPLKQFLVKLVNLEDLSFHESYELMECISQDSLSPAQIGSLITSFYVKKPSSDELSAFASLLIEKARKFDSDQSPCIDIVGTGGSAKKTFNVSSTAALLLASMGLRVAKHGNRGVTSKSGSADLLSFLGVNVDMSLEVCKRCYEELGLAFLFAPNIHSALRSVQGARRELGFKSIFNLLGPLSNPLRPAYSLIGVFDKEYGALMARALARLGSRRAMVVSSFDGLDEFSLWSSTHVYELKDGEILSYEFSPKAHGIKEAHFRDLRGGEVARNAEITLEILGGKPSGRADLVALNAGAALYLYGRAESIESGFWLAKDFLASKKALGTLEAFKKLSWS